MMLPRRHRKGKSSREFRLWHFCCRSALVITLSTLGTDTVSTEFDPCCENKEAGKELHKQILGRE
jgi:hypothetical protein